MYIRPYSFRVWRGFVSETFWASIQRKTLHFFIDPAPALRRGQRFWGCTCSRDKACIFIRLMSIWPNLLYVWKGFVTEKFWTAHIQELQSNVKHCSLVSTQPQTLRRFWACSTDEAFLVLAQQCFVKNDILSRQYSRPSIQRRIIQLCGDPAPDSEKGPKVWACSRDQACLPIQNRWSMQIW